MANINCIEVNDALQRSDNTRKSYYLEDAAAQINAIIGHPDDTTLTYLNSTKISDGLRKRGNAAHRRLYKMLMDEITSVGEITDYTVSPQLKLNGIADYIFITHGYIGHVNAVSRYPKPYIALEKTIGNLIDAQNRSKLSRVERAYMPLAMFAVRADKFGDMYDFARKATQLKENTIQSWTGFASSFNDANSGVTRQIENYLSNVKMLTAEFLVGGVKVNHAGQEITIIDSGYDENKIPIFIYTDETGAERTVKYSDINIKHVRDAVTRHWQYNVGDKLMQGEMRYVIFKPVAEGEDLNQLMEMFAEVAAYRKLDKTRPRPHMQYVFDPVNRVSYGYMMVKSLEGAFDENEHYRAYPVVMQKEGSNPELLYDPGNAERGIPPRYSRKAEVLDTANISVFRDGFYHATTYPDHGPILNKWMQPIEGSHKRGYSDFKYMPDKIEDDIHNIGVQPNMDMMLYNGVGVSEVGHSLFQMLRMKRGTYSAIYKDASRRGKDSQKQMKELLKEYANITGQGNAKTEEVLKSLEKMTNMNTNIHVDKNDEIVMQMSYFNPKKESYAPTMYQKTAVWSMLDNAEDEIYRRLSEMAGSEKIEDNEAYKAIQRNRVLTVGLEADAQFAGMNAAWDSRMPVQDLIQHAKHKSAWSDPRMRRRDARVEQDYLTSIYNALNKQQLMVDMLRGVNSALKNIKEPVMQEAVIDWYVNRTKIAVGDLTADAIIPLPFGGELNLGYEQVAASNRRAGLVNSTPESVQNSVLFMRSMLSSKLLGVWVALGNRMQSSNTFHYYGSRIFRQAASEIEDYSPNGKGLMWDHVLSIIGTDNIVSAFVENVASAASVSFGDMAWFGSEIPNPKVLNDVIGTFIRSKTEATKFVKHGVPVLDEYFKSLLRAQPMREKMRTVLKELHRQGYSGHKFINAADNHYKRILKASAPAEDQLERLVGMRQAFLDLVLMKEPSDIEYLKKEIEGRVTKKDMQDFARKNDTIRILIERHKILLGDVSSDMMRRVVAAKLGWWIGKGEWFTMSEGEKQMRKVDAVASLMMADAMGALTTPGLTSVVLNKVDPKSNREYQIPLEIPNKYTSPTAIHFARMSVNNNMFGMIPPYLGDSFSGVGNLAFQWKAYVLQQTIRDWNAMRSFHRGADFYGEGMVRVTQQIGQMLGEFATGDGYNPNAPIDHEARAYIRWFSTRVTASTIQAMAGMIRYVPVVKNLMTGRAGYALLRGGESPVLTVMLNLFMKSLIFMAFLDDDDDKGVQESLWDIMRMVMPPILSLFLEGIMAGGKKIFTDD